MVAGMAATTRVSEVDGARAEWSIVDGVVHVRMVRLADGTENVFAPTLELGQAFSEMPRRLWEEVLFRHGQIRRSGAHDSSGGRS